MNESLFKYIVEITYSDGSKRLHEFKSYHWAKTSANHAQKRGAVRTVLSMRPMEEIWEIKGKQ